MLFLILNFLRIENKLDFVLYICSEISEWSRFVIENKSLLKRILCKLAAFDTNIIKIKKNQ